MRVVASKACGTSHVPPGGASGRPQEVRIRGRWSCPAQPALCLQLHFGDPETVCGVAGALGVCEGRPGRGGLPRDRVEHRAPPGGSCCCRAEQVSRSVADSRGILTASRGGGGSGGALDGLAWGGSSGGSWGSISGTKGSASGQQREREVTPGGREAWPGRDHGTVPPGRRGASVGRAVASRCRDSRSVERGPGRVRGRGSSLGLRQSGCAEGGSPGLRVAVRKPPTGLKHSHCLTGRASESESGCRQGQLPPRPLGGSLWPLPAPGVPHPPVVPASPGGPGITCLSTLSHDLLPCVSICGCLL